MDPTTDGRPGRSVFPYALLVTSIVGFLGAGQLVLERLELLRNPAHKPSCDLNLFFSCGSVMQSWQAALFGFPNPLLGIVGFAVTLTVAMGLLAGARFANWFWSSLAVGVTLAFAFCVWLWSQALWDINRFCLYCMVVWAAMIPMFVLTWKEAVLVGAVRSTERLRSLVADWTWPVIALLYVGASASVAIRYIQLSS